MPFHRPALVLVSAAIDLGRSPAQGVDLPARRCMANLTSWRCFLRPGIIPSELPRGIIIGKIWVRAVVENIIARKSLAKSFPAFLIHWVTLHPDAVVSNLAHA